MNETSINLTNAKKEAETFMKDRLKKRIDKRTNNSGSSITASHPEKLK